MLPAPDLRLRIVEHLFAPEQHKDVLEALVSCSEGAPAGERDRVQIAVLKLCSEDPDRNLDAWLSAAGLDYRDVLLWAEQPGLARLQAGRQLTPGERKALRDQDKAQFDAWMRRVA